MRTDEGESGGEEKIERGDTIVMRVKMIWRTSGSMLVALLLVIGNKSDVGTLTEMIETSRHAINTDQTRTEKDNTVRATETLIDTEWSGNALGIVVEMTDWH
jgi:hypothetical protein